MDHTITTIYSLCDEFLKSIRHRDDPQVRLSTAEVMTVPLVAAAFFGANLDKSCSFLKGYGYMPTMISKSHLNRRLHTIDPSLWQALFVLLAESFKRRDKNPEQAYVVDSLPVAVCDKSSVSDAAGSILQKSTAGRSADTYRASGATSTGCGYIWW